ncbi:unnamed protein product [Paramecium primaurelia]|uniref:Uncharacterized protein n=1 Tax=Paramecium primaurelia TaxID=5886 RepID=A0A8S1PCX1_PARPR|nr:unnamed protein product [Paramecium primaurelia]
MIEQKSLKGFGFGFVDKAQIQFFCGKCLVEKINNHKVTTIEQSKERIQQIKIQQKDIKSKENQARLNYYKNILDQIMNFKQSIDDSLEKMYKQIQQYIFPIQKEKKELQECESQLNYFEDIKQLSELYSQEQQKSPKLIEDNHFVNEIQRQFELLFNNSEYFSTLDTIKSTKEKIKDIMENNVIELIPQFIVKNDSKTPSLSRICSNHKKEIIMIDMDSQEKKIEDRFVCVDCISENPNTKCLTIIMKLLFMQIKPCKLIQNISINYILKKFLFHAILFQFTLKIIQNVKYYQIVFKVYY